MKSEHIKISGARVHNLKNISVDIPKNSLTVITGLSGSGKSSLAFDTVYAEGQRRYAESLNAYARQFMDVQDKPDVDAIEGLSPTIAIDQKNTSQNPRSTVGTSTEIYDSLRLLFARLGKQHDPDTDDIIEQHTNGQIIEAVRGIGRNSNELYIVAPLIQQGKVKKKDILSQVESSEFHALRINGMMMSIHQVKGFSFEKDKQYDVDVVVEQITNVKKQNVTKSVEAALELGNGQIIIVDEDNGEEELFSTVPMNTNTNRVFNPIEPRSFSFNSPYGACPRCTGLGYTLDIDVDVLVVNPRLTINEGAIQVWSRVVGNSSQQQALMQAVASAKGFSLDSPVEKLSKKALDVLFYGTDGTTYDINGKKMVFEGIVPMLVQKHAASDSDYIRKEIEQYMKETTCPVCSGKRLSIESQYIKIHGVGIADITAMSIDEAETFFKHTEKNPSPLLKDATKQELTIAKAIMLDVHTRLKHLQKVGLGYLTLDRSITTVSGGEAQRIRLATQISTGLTDVIYILDEPSIGLHPSDTHRLIDTLKTLRDIGNTVIVVEHDEAMMREADYIIDIGPGAGIHGGKVIATGTLEDILASSSLTGQYLSHQVEIEAPEKPRKGNGKTLSIIGAQEHNLQSVNIDIPLGTLTTVTGVSGSGKSTLILGILSRALSKHFYRAKAVPGMHKEIKGIKNIDKVISIDQTPIGRTPRSNPATYTGVFTAIRDIFTNQPEAKMRGYGAGMFSFNVKGGGRCEACAGEGYQRIPMQFLPDVFVECPECHGKRYNKEALEIHYRGKDISDVLDMTIEEALRFFNDTTSVADKLRILRDVGLGYVKLGQSATTLSGGEAQRIKLATELARRSTGNTLYILDEPTTGLHFEDIKKLLHVLNKLVEKGNTVLTIEHNLDIVKAADHIIDLGPGGGKDGGTVVFTGTPKELLKDKKSLTAKSLREMDSEQQQKK